MAAPGSRDYGLLSVTVQMYGPVAPLFTLPLGGGVVQAAWWKAPMARTQTAVKLANKAPKSCH